MGRSQAEEALAVECGYWHLWRYNPLLADEGKNPFTLDSKEPQWDKFRDFLLGEVRYLSVQKAFPNEADELFTQAETRPMFARAKKTGAKPSNISLALIYIRCVPRRTHLFCYHPSIMNISVNLTLCARKSKSNKTSSVIKYISYIRECQNLSKWKTSYLSLSSPTIRSVP